MGKLSGHILSFVVGLRTNWGSTVSKTSLEAYFLVNNNLRVEMHSFLKAQVFNFIILVLKLL